MDMKKNKQITTEQLLLTIKTICPNAIIFEGFNDCIVGINISMPNYTNVVYSKVLIAQKLMENDYDVIDAIKFFYDKFSSTKFDSSVEPIFLEDNKYEINYN
jgi:hypothetical protein